MLTLTSPVEIWAHRVPAWVKLAALCGFTMLLFWLSTPWALGLVAAGVLGLLASGGMRFAASAVRLLWPLWPFVLIVGLWHLWSGDVSGGAVVILRLLAAVSAANFVTMTTPLSQMIAVLQMLARPFAALGLNPRSLALAVALVIRFIPVMLERHAQIAEGWRARSPRLPGWRVLVPLTLAALDDAERVAEALRARGGGG